jgi:UDP-glucose 4-epimerase
MILVIGGCGYIGSHIVKALSESGEQVIVFDNLTTGNASTLLHGETLVKGDITDPSALEKVFTDYKVDIVIHLAALVNAAESVKLADEYTRVNTEGSRLVFASAARAGVKHIVFASSAAVYGVPGAASALAESAPLVPTNPYGQSKVDGEQLLRELASKTGIHYGIFRFFNVAGAARGSGLHQSPQNRAILTRLFAAAAGDVDSITVSGHDYDTIDGTVVRDFIHVEDVADGVVRGVEHMRAGGESFTLNLGGGHAISIKQLIAQVESVTGQTLNIIYGPRIPGDTFYSLSDSSQAQRVLDWKPTRTIKTIVEDAWRAYRDST